jgi:ribonucleotide reductase class II
MILQDVQFYDKYSRFNGSRREDWGETVQRVTEYLWKFDTKNIIPQEKRKEIYTAIYNKDIMPSMRNLAMAGPAAERQNACSYNCAFTIISDLFAFSEAVIILMSGAGLGYSVERQYVDNLPVVRPQSGEVVHHTVADTTEGWAEAVYVGLLSWFGGMDVIFDYSKIRPAGTPLKIKGGRASGPDTLRHSLDKIRAIILSAQDYKLRSIDAHDIMCHLAACIVSGGVRRSAMISLFDYDDTDMLTCKNQKNIIDNEQRYFANNSAVWLNRKTKTEVETFMNNMFSTFMGEPGIFSRYAANRNLNHRRTHADFGTNPCQPGFATVLTKTGIKTFADIDIGSEIWSESGWTKVINKWDTGVKPVFEYETTAGTFVGTENHKVVSRGEKVEAAKAYNIDILEGNIAFGVVHIPQVVLDGLVLGDGGVHAQSKQKVYLIIGENDQDYFNDPVSTLIIEKHAAKYDTAWKVNTTIQEDELPRVWDRTIPGRFLYNADHNTVASFLRGLYSANGSVVGQRVTLKSTSLQLVKEVQIMLSSLGIRSYYTTNKATKVQHHNGEYTSKQSYDLNISTDRALFYNTIGFIQKYKMEKLYKILSMNSVGDRVKTHDIISVNYLGEFEVFDITVDNETHTYWTGGVNVSNCGEIFLRPYQFCNLSSVVCRADDTEATLETKVELATIIGTLQAMSDYFPGLRQEWRQNQIEERLLGVDLNGIMDCETIRNPYIQERLKNHAIRVNAEYSDKFGVNQSVAVTCIKPSGNSSVLLDTSPGIHTRWSKFYIRRIELHKDNPILQILQYYNVPTEKALYKRDTWIAAFPVKAPKGAKVNGMFSAVEQLETWKAFKTHWTEHNPSVTITYKDSERQQIIDWVYENQDYIGGLSFLPGSDSHYEQMPYEAISQEKYIELIQTFPKIIDWNLLHILEEGLGDMTSASQLGACSSDKCLI